MAIAEGIPPTASTVVPGLSLNYIGNHCYAMASANPASTGSSNILKFTSGEGYILGEFVCSGPINAGDPGGGIGTFEFKFNDSTVLWIKVDSGAEDQPSTQSARIMIPPFTDVVVIITSTIDDASFENTATFTGRVYRV